jgi:exonuclease I
MLINSIFITHTHPFTKKIQQDATKYQNFIMPYLYEAQHDNVRHSVPDIVHQLHVQQPSMYEKPEAASAVLGS